MIARRLLKSGCLIDFACFVQIVSLTAAWPLLCVYASTLFATSFDRVLDVSGPLHGYRSRIETVRDSSASKNRPWSTSSESGLHRTSSRAALMVMKAVPEPQAPLSSYPFVKPVIDFLMCNFRHPSAKMTGLQDDDKSVGLVLLNCKTLETIPLSSLHLYEINVLGVVSMFHSHAFQLASNRAA